MLIYILYDFQSDLFGISNHNKSGGRNQIIPATLSGGNECGDLRHIHKIERNHTIGMESSEREDYLEAVLVRHLAAQAPPSAEDVAGDLSLEEDTVSADLKSLENQGDLVFDEKGAISLTVQGHSTAERVLKKHRVLQCFLGEILGMEEHAASDEACVLEHSISDSTINRIGNYVKKAGSRRGRHRGNIPLSRLMNNAIPKPPDSCMITGSKQGLPGRIIFRPGVQFSHRCDGIHTPDGRGDHGRGVSSPVNRPRGNSRGSGYFKKKAA